MIVNENNTMPYMKSLSACIEKMVEDGYVEDFQAVEEGLKALRTESVYRPEEVNIVNFFRFEGASDPDDMSILYVLETNDGLKGTLIDAYGPYASPEVNQFIVEVERISKKTKKEE